MIIIGGKTYSYCADCCQAPVADYGNVCGKCQSIRTVMAESRAQKLYIPAVVVVGSVMIVLSIVCLLLKHH